MNVTPHVAAKVKGSAIDGRTTRHRAIAVSQRNRKRIEEAFGWGKTVGTAAKTMLRGTPASASSSRSTWPPTISPDCRSCSPPEAGTAENTPSAKLDPALNKG